MLQRIQTVFLALTTVASLLLFFFPLAGFYNETEGNYHLYIYGIRCLDPDPRFHFGNYFTLPLVFFTIVSIILSFSTVFLYKKRVLQSRICTFNILINIVFLMVLFFFYINKIKTIAHSEPDYNLFGMLLPLIAMIFLVLANRAIKKDENLVKSADRLR